MDSSTRGRASSVEKAMVSGLAQNKILLNGNFTFIST